MTMNLLVKSLGGQPAVLARRRSNEPGRLVVLLRGGGNQFEYLTRTESPYGDVYANLRDVGRVLTQNGYTVLIPQHFDTSLPTAYTEHGNTFGNNASTTAVKDAIDAAQSEPGVIPGKVAFLTISAGLMTAFNYMRRFGQTNVAGILAHIPACSLGAYRGNYIAQGAAYQDVNLAHGLCLPDGLTGNNDSTYTSSIEPTYDPIIIAPSITVPCVLWTQDNDLYAPPLVAQIMEGLMGANASVVARGNGDPAAPFYGHDFTTVNGSDVFDVLETFDW